MVDQLTQNKVARRRKELSNFMLVLEEIMWSHQLNMLVIRMLLSILIFKKSKKTRRFWRNRTVKPEPVDENCTDARWKWFKGCLGALDGTYINGTRGYCETHSVDHLASKYQEVNTICVTMGMRIVKALSCHTKELDTI
ncbi:hypothetical protein AAHA92_22601 [Salvia divinorum]|uniref:Uncharacterized protein n=1 Tax=Salvia divinorum TaxID=28513 RepID=A0ABD1GSA6_SALDI